MRYSITHPIKRSTILLTYKNLVKTYNFQSLIINRFLPSLILFHDLRFKISNSTFSIFHSSRLNVVGPLFFLFLLKKIIALHSPVSPAFLQYEKKEGEGEGWKFRNPIHNLSSARKHSSTLQTVVLRFFLFDRHLYPMLYPLLSSISGATCRQLRMLVYFPTGQ